MALPLTAEERLEYEGYLRDAKKALHELTLGGAVRVFVDQNGERIEYAAANRGNLRAYVMELQAALGLPLGICGPMRIHPW